MTQQSSARPFRVLGIQQIAIGGPSKERLKKLWVDMFGLAVTGNFVSERENVDEDITAMGSGPFKVEVDLMQPLDPEKSRPCTNRRSTTSACGSTTCRRPSNGSPRRACASRRAASARAPPASTSPSCTPRPTSSSRSAAKAC
jgi:hypothetical protein